MIFFAFELLFDINGQIDSYSYYSHKKCVNVTTHFSRIYIRHQGITVFILIMPNIKPITIRFSFIGVIVLYNIKIILIVSLITDLA